MVKEFREFIMRGNVIDLAVGFIMGVAFTAIVTSLVNDIIMPPIGMLLGGVDFSNIVITLKAATDTDPAVTMNIGIFINTVIQFVIIAFVVFLLVRMVNNMRDRLIKKEVAVAAAVPSPEEKLLVAINDLTAAIREEKK